MGRYMDEVGDASRDLIGKYLRDFYRENKYMPTLAQIARHTGLERNAVVWHIDKMRDQKIVKFEDGNMARSLRLR